MTPIFDDLELLLEKAISSAIEETIPNSEKDRQDRKTKALKHFRAPKDSKSSDNVDEEDPAEPEKGRGIIKPRKSSLPEINLNIIIDKLNIIRSGKSLDKKEVKAELKNYFSSLNGSERVALFAFLKGLSKIIAADEEGDKVKSPSQKPYDIKMRKEKNPAIKSKASGEDTPIVVGESANKRKEKIIFGRNLK